MRIDPGGGVSIGPVAHNQPIDQTKVTVAVRQAEMTVPLSGSNLAGVLINPDLNQAERDQIIQDLARQSGQPMSFYANDAYRMHGSDFSSLRLDQSVIADGVQQAYADGAINAQDLLHIANFNPNQVGGAQRFLDVLMQGGSATLQGSAAEALANALWARNGNSGIDKAAAAMYYTSDPTIMANDLNTPAKRADAFEALVNFNQTAPYDNVPPGQLATAFKNEALGAEANLFVGNTQEIVQDFTLRNATQIPDTQVLAKFMSQTVFNPSAQDIQLSNYSSLKNSMSDALAGVSKSLIDTAKQAPPGSLQEHYAIEQYGRLSAALSGGAALALTNYDAQVQANDATRQQWADLVGGLVGNYVKIDTPLGNPAEKVASDLTSAIYNAIVPGPQRPTAALADTLYDHYAQTVEQLRTQPGQPPDLTSDFDSTYGATLLQLQAQLNVNLGGHAN
jgi:hypothetical protein